MHFWLHSFHCNGDPSLCICHYTKYCRIPITVKWGRSKVNCFHILDLENLQHLELCNIFFIHFLSTYLKSATHYLVIDIHWYVTIKGNLVQNFNRHLFSFDIPFYVPHTCGTWRNIYRFRWDGHLHHSLLGNYSIFISPACKTNWLSH